MIHLVLNQEKQLIFFNIDITIKLASNGFHCGSKTIQLTKGQMEIIYRIPDLGDHPYDNVMQRNFMLSFLQIVENAEKPIIFVSIGDIIEHGRKFSYLEIIAVR